MNECNECVYVCIQAYFPNGFPAVAMSGAAFLLFSPPNRGTTLPQLRLKWTLNKVQVTIKYQLCSPFDLNWEIQKRYTLLLLFFTFSD